MMNEEIDLPKTYPLADAAQTVEVAATATGLRMTLRGTLGMYPGCIHWHFKRGKESGTLEVTLLNWERRILISVRENRRGPWTDDAVQAILVYVQNVVRELN